MSVRGFIYKEVKRYLTLNLYSLHPLYRLGATPSTTGMTRTLALSGGWVGAEEVIICST
jgi:hypothetical protein